MTAGPDALNSDLKSVPDTHPGAMDPGARTGQGAAVPLPIAGRRQTLAMLDGQLRSMPVLAAAALLLCLAAAGCGLAAPWLIGAITNTVLEAMTAGPDAAGAAEDRLIGLVAVLVAAGVAAAGLTAVSAACVSRLGQRLLAGMRETALTRALELPGETVEASGHGDVLSRVGDDVAVVSQAVTALLAPWIGAVLTVVLTVAGLAALDPRLALAGLCAVPVYYFALRWYLPRAAPRYAAERVAFAERAEVVTASLAGVATLQAYRAEEAYAGKISTASAKARDISRGALWFYTGWSKWLNIAELTGLGMILLTGFLLSSAEIVTVGAVTAAALYFHRLFNPLGIIISSFDEIQSAAASLARIAGLAGAEAGPGTAKRKPAGAPQPAGSGGGTATADLTAAGEVAVENLTHRYGSTTVLDNVSLTIADREHIALVGPSGAGKSTLAALIAGVLTPAEGAIRRGPAVPSGPTGPDTTARETPRTVLVAQEPHVFAGPLIDDLRLARPDATAADVDRALELVGAAPWVAALERGTATVIGESGHALTPGQAAQLALARAWLADPAVLILDEATAEAGSAEAGVLEAAATAVMRGRTAVVVAHRLTQAAAADRVIMMDAGRILEQGSHAELLAHRGAYAGLWAAWQR
ncbi:ABC transporter ATP-binding protein [Arthrobacter sp. zg-Y820]|uniref:ABC transporter ATP-binding protein n=1 Tax=unclassified Arthrobacter TaxID=235627 RepID=UPI001E5F748C|nr:MULTISPECIES: ABC transporter ATP-binding protein [unclassified Arthrobacter]MCC9196876.1 ABC transporter ATP-binding protein/permease [Arthrobacter sp. zg-Y820]MDK1279740.1 ABC transporter ATP-binding protein [Arthrobacter sp. zg.Y820]WIB11004.1 ABC transporter ATP-binding protein [Arthrobacter sp. zg-Y820]